MSSMSTHGSLKLSNFRTDNKALNCDWLFFKIMVLGVAERFHVGQRIENLLFGERVEQPCRHR